jgi:hypothetical protein
MFDVFEASVESKAWLEKPGTVGEREDGDELVRRHELPDNILRAIRRPIAHDDPHSRRYRLTHDRVQHLSDVALLISSSGNQNVRFVVHHLYPLFA